MLYGAPQSLPHPTTYWEQLRTIWGCLKTFIKTAEDAEAVHFFCAVVSLRRNIASESVSDGAGVLRCAEGQVRLILLIAWRSTLAGGCQIFDARVFAYCAGSFLHLQDLSVPCPPSNASISTNELTQSSPSSPKKHLRNQQNKLCYDNLDTESLHPWRPDRTHLSVLCMWVRAITKTMTLFCCEE
ncbi:hypothetical protein ATANTOWER_012805 [Ataeniobius toweri]|uniref:Uncharacterized protein n=1 Tax=Ataeniobius toweri TaxID=208326 RepID=A0ABU7AXN2_9TELE|nr:hypothetical protein [Ataeniobius toweri]